MRAVLIVLDGLPVRHVSALVTAQLFQLACRGGWAPGGGWSVMSSTTPPNLVTLVTGVDPARHGVLASEMPAGDTVVPACEVGPAVPTLFEAARVAGLRSAVVLGDPCLVGMTGADVADHHWPPGGRCPETAATDDGGHAADGAVLEELLPVLADDYDLVVAHFSGPDTAGHLLGPDSPAALAAYAAADALLEPVVAALGGRWDDTVLGVVSDHDQEPVLVPEPVDLAAAARERRVEATVVTQGGAALVAGPGAHDTRWIEAVDGVGGTLDARAGLRLVWAEGGRWFGTAADASDPPRGVHGGTTTRAQVAVVGGGHPAVGPIARCLGRRRPDAADWPTTIAALLGLHLPAACGRVLGG